MKETVKTSRTAGYLEKIFRALNAKYFNGELEEPIITIQSTPRAYGHVTVAKAWQRGDTTRHELNIGAGTLARPIEPQRRRLHPTWQRYGWQHRQADREQPQQPQHQVCLPLLWQQCKGNQSRPHKMCWLRHDDDCKMKNTGSQKSPRFFVSKFGPQAASFALMLTRQMTS